MVGFSIDMFVFARASGVKTWNGWDQMDIVKRQWLNGVAEWNPLFHSNLYTNPNAMFLAFQSGDSWVYPYQLNYPYGEIPLF